MGPVSRILFPLVPRDAGSAVIYLPPTLLAELRRAAALRAFAQLTTMRHTRGYRTGSPASYFVLHQKGFFVPSASRRDAVGSYPTFSPFPSAVPPPAGPRENPEPVEGWLTKGSLIFCDTFRRRLPRCGVRRLHLPRGSCSILPYGVRTFLSKLQRARQLAEPWDQRTWSDGQAPKLRGKSVSK